MSQQTSFTLKKYLLMTLDPVHIGTGGYRLGRVELSIVREPGTRLPKIPGTSLSGAIRQYAAYRYGKRTCAGQKGHCGQPTCPICYTFGSVTEKGSFSGVVSIGDSRILLFPVYSMAGPVWVTSPGTLADFGTKGQKVSVSEDKAKWKGITSQNHLNLGWLMVSKEGDLDLNLPSEIPEEIRKRVVLVSNELFSVVVNSNLEVRTSVSINPETGAAEEGALFTYEAIPRATVLWMEVVVDDFRGAFPSPKRLQEWKAALEGNDRNAQQEIVQKWGLWQGPTSAFQQAVSEALDWVTQDLNRYGQNSWQSPADVVQAGLEWAEYLGIGGMGTRGFGRIRLLGEVSYDGQSSQSG